MIKLTIELVPKTCFFSNARTLLPKKEWDKLRKESYKEANYKCEICGDTSLNQGKNYPVECHEVWVYDDIKHVQKLNNLQSLCSKCHQVKHFGRTSAIGKQPDAIAHIQKVNGWDHKETAQYLAEVFAEHAKRSKKKWKLDISILHEVYGVTKKLITEAHKKRKVK